MPEDDPRHADWAERADALLFQAGDRWPGEPNIRAARYQRGLIDSVHLDNPTADQLRGVFAGAPVRHLRLSKIDPASVAELVSLPELARLQTFGLDCRLALALAPDGLHALTESPHLANLTGLTISQFRLTRADVQTLAQSSHLQGLTRLTLLCCELTNDAALALSAAPLRLRSLNLGWNYLSQFGLAPLLASPVCAGLEELTLDENSLGGPDIARTIQQTPHLNRLTYLNLSDARIGPDGAAALASTPHLANLRTLTVQNCDLGDAGVEALATSPHLANLRELWLCRNGLTATGLTALTRAPFWPHFRHLTLNDETLTDAAFVDWLEAPALADFLLWHAGVSSATLLALVETALPGLRHLALCYLPHLDDAGLLPLLAASNLERLTSLSLEQVGLTGMGLTALVHADLLPRLRRLSIMNQPLGDAGAEAIAAWPEAEGLRELILPGCSISDAGATALTRSSYLGRLRTLSLYSNPITPSTAGQLLRERFGSALVL